MSHSSCIIEPSFKFLELSCVSLCESPFRLWGVKYNNMQKSSGGSWNMIPFATTVHALLSPGPLLWTSLDHRNSTGLGEKWVYHLRCRPALLYLFYSPHLLFDHLPIISYLISLLPSLCSRFPVKLIWNIPVCIFCFNFISLQFSLQAVLFLKGSHQAGTGTYGVFLSSLRVLGPRCQGCPSRGNCTWLPLFLAYIYSHCLAINLTYNGIFDSLECLPAGSCGEENPRRNKNLRVIPYTYLIPNLWEFFWLSLPRGRTKSTLGSKWIQVMKAPKDPLSRRFV